METERTKKSWWKTKPAVGAMAGLVGFSLGMGSSGEASEPVTPPPVTSTATVTATPEAVVTTATVTETITETVVSTTTVTEPAETVMVTVVPEPTTAPPTEAAVVPETKPEPKADAYYKNCDAARAAGVAPLLRGEPGYRSALDRDNDGVACE